MYCIHCGKENPSSARFCMHCGKAIPDLKPETEPEPQVAEEIQPEPKIEAEAEEETHVDAGVQAPSPAKPIKQIESKSKPEPDPEPKSKTAAPRKTSVKRQPVIRERCPVCGFAIRPGIRYCEGCGVQLNHVKIMTCKACGYVNRPGVAFCEGCGGALDVDSWEGEACPSCGYPNRLGVCYCEDCGVSLQAQAEAAAKEKKQTVAQLRKISFKMIWRYMLPKVLGGSVGGFVVGKLGQWMFQNLL